MIIPDRKEKYVCRACDNQCFHRPASNGKSFGKRSGTGSEWHYKTYEVLQCEHCENVVLCIHHWTNPGPMIGDSYITKTEFFPPKQFWKKPLWFPKLSKAYQKIFSEVYSALDSSLFILAATGIRTALDKVMVEKIGDIGRFETKVDRLVEKEIITPADKELLMAVVNAGSASAHRGYSPTIKATTHMMEITEHIFYKLCFEQNKTADLLSKARTLRRATPGRKKA
ncbi:hypothetical protein Gbem_0417 [Citrifermentans bemidjiense Bem]|uniref:DUF4145 domain-containing protein n=1 Tax=Citrifermentans bemidjiense (strain ATCC BAA-1014 / DSM 16622 / JCM 12645 / Bem) TaxID=404380 RepID=B5EBH7_CITBB|nr:DUF4145 domain-containing protein [Citrifermentans bemidjiense]ACH37446.1 hypothetical protein Gbem_0417 [Citrifermentans bemidjiense Bem]